MTKMKLMAAGIAVVLAASAGGGWVLYRNAATPARRAETLAAQGNFRGAQVELRNAVRADPKNADLHVRMARLQMKLADPVAAEKEFRVAGDLGADRWAIIAELGEAMIAQGMIRETLLQVPAGGPTPELAAKNLLLRSIAQLSLSDIPGATATLAEAQRVAPGSFQVALIAARIAASNNDLAGTEAKVDEVLRLDPRQIDALIMKQQLVAASGDKAGALALATRAVESAPWSAMARVTRATLLLTAGEDAKAQSDVDAVIEAQPRFSEALYLRAILMARRGRNTDAALELAKLEPMAQRFPQVLFYQSLVASNLGQIESAADFARRYNALVPRDPDGVRRLARAELTVKRPANALTVLEKATAAGLDDPEALDLLGRTYAMLGNTQAALLTFGKAASQAPQDTAIMTHLGLSQMQDGKAADAAATLQRSIDLEPKQQTAGEALVAAALESGDIDKAETALAQLRKEAGETEQVGILTGMVRLRRQDPDGARIALTNTLRAFPASVGAKLALARVLVQQGRRADGLLMMTEILAKDPANRQVLNSYLPLLLQERQLPPAIQALEAAHKADPKQDLLTAMLADALTTAGTPERAIALLQGPRGSIGLPPSLLIPLARAQVAAGQPTEAAATYRAAVGAVPGNLVVRSAQVDFLLRNKDFDAARDSLKEALAASPGNLRVMTTLVANEAASRGIDSALAMTTELRNQPANMPYAAALKGDLLMQVGRPAEAAEAFQAEYKAVPSLPLLMRMTAAFGNANQDDRAAAYLGAWLRDHPDSLPAAQALAQLDIKAKRYDDAQRHLALVLDKDPGNAFALNNLAWTYFQIGDARARATAQKAYLQAPSPDAGDTLGWIMVQQGEAKGAVLLLQRSGAERPNDPSIQYHLAVALKNDGRPDEAAKVLDPIVASNDAFDDKAAARTLLDEIRRTSSKL